MRSQKRFSQENLPNRGIGCHCKLGLRVGCLPRSRVVLTCFPSTKTLLSFSMRYFTQCSKCHRQNEPKTMSLLWRCCLGRMAMAGQCLFRRGLQFCHHYYTALGTVSLPLYTVESFMRPQQTPRSKPTRPLVVMDGLLSPMPLLGLLGGAESPPEDVHEEGTTSWLGDIESDQII